MTKPLRHTTHEIKTAASIAAELNISVRLESDGAITFIPANHRQETNRLDHGLTVPASSGFQEWLEGQKNEGENNGRS